MCYSFLRGLGMHMYLETAWSFCNSALIFLLIVEDKECPGDMSFENLE